ncbi:MAG TPA: PEP-CTERM sorting domain-containing protein [Bryobacteraceae bacterium]
MTPVACASTGIATANCTASLNGLAPGGPFTISAGGSATAAYGSLFATVNASVNPTSNGPGLSDFLGQASASFDDTLTVFGGTGLGYISYAFNGSITSITQTPGNQFTVQQGNLPPGGFGIQTFSNGFNQPFNYQTPFYAFTFGVPFTLNVEAQAFTQSAPGDGFGTGSVRVNLSGITVVGPRRQPVSFTIASKSGAVYATPEPSSLLLTATLAGLVGLAIRKRTPGCGSLRS